MTTINFKTFQNYTQKLYQSDSEFDATQTDRLARHRHLEPESAQFLASFIISKNAKSVLEIGTSTGYSTLWIAYALQKINFPSQFVSIDVDNDRLLKAKEHLTKLTLLNWVTLKQMDAKDLLASQMDSFDVIFLDAERAFYMDYVKDLKAILKFGNTLIVDNVVSHADEVTAFLAEFEKDDNFLCTTLPIGAGLFLAVKQQ